MSHQMKTDLLTWTLILFAFNQVLFAGIAIEVITTQAAIETPVTVLVATATITLLFTSTCAAVGGAIVYFVKQI